MELHRREARPRRPHRPIHRPEQADRLEGETPGHRCQGRDCVSFVAAHPAVLLANVVDVFPRFIYTDPHVLGVKWYAGTANNQVGARYIEFSS